MEITSNQDCLLRFSMFPPSTLYPKVTTSTSTLLLIKQLENYNYLYSNNVTGHKSYIVKRHQPNLTSSTDFQTRVKICLTNEFTGVIS